MKKKTQTKQKNCLYCDSCVPLGEGDHFCNKMNVIVVEEYVPNENFCCCLGEED